MSRFRKTTSSDIAKSQWDFSEIIFDCKCGETDIYLSNDSETTFICECGKEYKLVCHVLVKD